jgi:hypothetical protein
MFGRFSVVFGEDKVVGDDTGSGKGKLGEGGGNGVVPVPVHKVIRLITGYKNNQKKYIKEHNKKHFSDYMKSINYQ